MSARTSISSTTQSIIGRRVRKNQTESAREPTNLLGRVLENMTGLASDLRVG